MTEPDTTPAPDFRPIQPNPYIVGNPIRGRAMFFGREAEFEMVARRFCGRDQGGLLVFCGERRSGKTSILFQILDGRLGPEFTPVLIDMQSMVIDSQVDFLEKIANEVIAAVGPEADLRPPRLTEGSNPIDAFREFIVRAQRAIPNRKLLLLIDEYELIEHKIDSGILVPDVLNLLSGLMTHQSLFLIFTGSQNLEGRKPEYWRILGGAEYKDISYLDRRDAENLIRRPLEGLVSYEPDAVEAILRLTSGQPFYTQAICQGLVDNLNEARSRNVTVARIDEVVRYLVENPLPQTTFLWDGLHSDEKVLLALLAETLAGPDDFATPGKMSRTLRRRSYRIAYPSALISTTAEKLFKQELLLKPHDGRAPSFAFRMDLWRRWVRRMHSMWQVIREERLPQAQREAWWRDGRWLLVGATAFAAVAFVDLRVRDVVPGIGPRFATRGGPSVDTASTGMIEVVVQPRHASIYLDGELVGTGNYHDRVLADRTLTVRIAAPGYADTLLNRRLASGDSVAIGPIQLRPLLGAMSVVSTPPGIGITVDGRAIGRSPVRIDDLPVPVSHTVKTEGRDGRWTARIVGNGSVNELNGAFEVTVPADETVQLILDRAVLMGSLMITTEPSGAQIAVDGHSRGASPVQVTDLPPGPRTIRCSLAGYAPLESTVVVQDRNLQVHVRLLEDPPGAVMVLGDVGARIFIDNELVANDEPNSGWRSVRPGPHTVRVLVGNQQPVDATFNVGSRERVRFDFSRKSVQREPR